MACKSSRHWNFSANPAAREASAEHLGFYSSKLFALCKPAEGKAILPPAGEIPLAHKDAENAVIEAVIHGTGNAYAPSIGVPAAKCAVAKYLSRGLPEELSLKADDVFMTVGCKQAIELAVDLLAKPKGNVLLPSPGWPWEVARSIYKKLEVRRYTFLSNNEIDFDSVRKQADENTFAIFIINPHNPHGNTYSRAHLNELAILAAKLGMMVASDEVYRWTVFGDNPFVPMGTFSDIVPVMTLGSISKGWCLPGWRTGWLALHDPYGVFQSKMVVTAAKEFLGITSKPPTLIQAAIPSILEDTPDKFFHKRQSELRSKVDWAYSYLKDNIYSLECYVKPEACTFLWTKLNLELFKDISDDIDFCEKLAKEENLVVLPGIAFGLSGWLRHSIDMDMDPDNNILETAFRRLKDFCETHTIPILH